MKFNNHEKKLAFSVGFGQLVETHRIQQDSFDVLELCASHLYLIVADGMGGFKGGDIASSSAVLAFCNNIKNQFNSETARPCLKLALDAANLEVERISSHDATLAGMGTTLLTLQILDSGFRWLSVGDSVLFLIRENKIVRLNEDHVIVQEFRGLDRSDSDDEFIPLSFIYRGRLLSSVSGKEIRLVDYDVGLKPLRLGDILILASDSFLAIAKDDVLAECYSAIDGPSLVECLLNKVRCDDLCTDNITILAVLVGDAL